MDALLESLYARREVLMTARARAEKMLDGAPEGKVRISTRKGKSQFYLFTDHNQAQGKYIRSNEHALVESLVHKDYAQRIICKIDRENRALNAYIRVLEKDNPDCVYEMLSKQRRNLIQPIMLTAEKFAELWQIQPFTANALFIEQKQYETKRGEMVRSKSEMLFANLYYELGIPYRYECSLKLRDGTVKYPDFTLLDVRHRRFIYHEHFGLMDDPEYREECFKKLDIYRRNGIYVGKNLITTFEGRGSELNMREMRIMMKELFGLE